ncbi:MAG: hypothetical protein KKD05_04090 [Candidatus Omnitrophica bacterium]|nr:hypothetical protein [Candidatus Omnitrophota bacterium]
MKKIITKILIFVSLFCLPSIVFAQDGSDQEFKTRAELQRVLLENFDAYEKEEIARVLPTVHSLSPTYGSIKDTANKIFPVYDLKYELMNFRYLLTDGDYAIARVLQKTSKVTGPAFRNNLIDLIVVFKQEKNQWKLWSQIILEIEFLN